MPFDRTQPGLHELGYLLAEAPKNVVFVVGAGLSAPAGVVMWNQLNAELSTIASEVTANAKIDPTLKITRMDRLANPGDPWLLGDFLREVIPQDKYTATVKRLLTPKGPAPAYGKIWKLNPSGIISLNLDTLAETALAGTKDQVATAQEEQRFSRFLLSNRQFLLQPHGHYQKPPSWVLGARARNALLKNAVYRKFISAVFGSRRLVFTGIGPRDFAIETLLLDDFRNGLTRGAEHYWIRPSPSVEDREWAANYSISIIEYLPADDTHSELVEILDYLAAIGPRQTISPIAYEGAEISPKDLPPDDNLRTQSVEDIRRRLNAALKGALRTPAQDPTDTVAKMFEEYSGSVHMAWHIKEDGPYGIVWGHRVIKPLGSGAFGSVWRVQDSVSGQYRAMKVLHEQHTGDRGFLEAFRRGVRANRLLSEAGISGMVKYFEAFDIPCCVFMEYIEGSTFEEQLKTKQIRTIQEALNVIAQVGKVVQRGHELDKQVLHRDLKPANIVIRTEWSDGERVLEAVVLDFDLSWYEGAFGKSTLVGMSRLHNYISPEQLPTRDPKYSSRHTAVDVFGLGMLTFFAATGTEPELNVQNTRDFRDSLEEKISKRWTMPFQAVAPYLSLVIEEATLTAQGDRPSLPTLIEQVELISGALATGRVEGDLVALEVATRLGGAGWLWTPTLHGMASIVLRKNECTATLGMTDGLALQVVLSYSHSGQRDHSNVRKYTRTRCEQSAAILKKAGFKDVAEQHSDIGEVSGQMPCPRGCDAKEIANIASSVVEAACRMALAEA